MLVRFVALLYLLDCAACSCISKSEVSSEQMGHCQSGFKTVSSIGEVPNLVDRFLSENPGENSCWVVWDIDYTLTIPALIHDNKKYVMSKGNLAKLR